MKLVLITMVTLSSVFSFAASCPKTDTTVKSCVVDPQPDDYEIAISLAEGIAVCQNADGVVSLVLSGEGLDNESAVADVEMRPGGTTYSFMQDTVKFALNLTTGTLKPVTKAKLTVTFTESDNLSASATFKCE